MSDSQYLYNYYRQRYYNSCSEINSCEHQIYNLNNERRRVVDRINQLNRDIRETRSALDSLKAVAQRESSLTSRLSAVSGKTGQAAANFSGMVHASDIVSKDITEVFGSETTKTKNALNGVWNTLKSKKSSVDTKLSGLQNDLNQANSNLKNIDGCIFTNIKEEKQNQIFTMQWPLL